MAGILFVCTGNVCRSPLAEAVLRDGLRRRLGDGHGVHVASAGTGALVGEGMTPPTLALAERCGVDGRGHRARQVTRELVAGADLVVALARTHRSAVAGLHPGALRSLFTVRELARLLTDLPTGSLPDGDAATRVAALAPVAASRRGRQPATAAELDDVVDPYRRSAAVYEQMAAEVLPAVESLVAVLAPQDAALES